MSISIIKVNLFLIDTEDGKIYVIYFIESCLGGWSVQGAADDKSD